MPNKYDALKLENQLCFPLYVCAKEVVKAYKPYLDKLDLTYTQYITMMVMWERKELKVKDLGGYLYLDSGTLTPLLKRLEEKGFVSRKRSEKDERDMIVTLTDAGEKLKRKAAAVPEKLAACISIEPEKARELYEILYEIIGKLAE
ncbi:MAG: MarR family transcriptional regulator [Ruminococcus sp.]|nr:MarR family transcriptional regulator [Ruminococcus sp.]MCM1381354.1 MarR family transcriptional regulator [Muribaculaceae bacterium]MCM1479579.1 MarR family transcriptional regulator [Muribaculaceae bacterium]